MTNPPTVLQQQQQQPEIHSNMKNKAASDNDSGFNNSDNMKKTSSPYFLEYDQEEIDRLHEQHEAIKIVVGGNFEAPVHEGLEQGIKVLESGCGPGFWIKDMCNQYPRSTFYAMDIWPQYASVEQLAKHQNCKFVCADMLNPPLPFPDNHFDYIHQQLLVYGIKAHRWPDVLDELMRVLKPGGYIELNEIPVNDFFNLGPKLVAISKCLKQDTLERGFRVSISRELEGYLLEAGAVNTEVKPASFPLNHSGPVGEFWSRSHIFGLYRRAHRPMIEKVYPEMKSDETFDKYLLDVAAECKELKTKTLFFRVYGQKPLSPGDGNDADKKEQQH